jgi:purine catabolism regulator
MPRAIATGAGPAGRPTHHRHALPWLLARVDERAAATFVDHELAELAAYDREHGTDLQRVLELALDHADRGSAAEAAFMHRNTFRRQLATALRLLDADLGQPEERLALHLALKLRAARRR